MIYKYKTKKKVRISKCANGKQRNKEQIDNKSINYKLLNTQYTVIIEPRGV